MRPIWRSTSLASSWTATRWSCGFAAAWALAEQPQTLIDRVAEKLLYVPMSAELKQDILAAVTSLAIPTPDNDPAWINMVKERRAKTAMLLIVASAEYQVQR